MRLIDADALRDQCDDPFWCVWLGDIDNAPTIDAVPVDDLCEKINEAHNEGYDVGYWAGRRDYEPKWIPVTERLPEEGTAVNITWVNHSPSIYYQHLKDKPQTATGVYYRRKWYWWSTVVQDYLAEYGGWGFDEMDDAIEVTHWMPIPEPPKEETHDNN